MALTTSMTRMRAPLLLLLAAAACRDTPHPAAPTVDDPGRHVESQISCTASIADGRVTCGAPAAAGRQTLIIGGQGEYLQLTSNDVRVVADTFAFDVSIQNLIRQPMGTADGATADPEGIRVFFEQLPSATAGSGELTLEEIDGEATLLRADQPFYRYGGILQPDSVTAERTWKIRFDPTVDAFAFTVFVAASVPNETSWVDLAPGPDYLLTGQSHPLTATLRTRTGREIEGAALRWSSSDSLVARVDSTGLVTALAPGVATIEAASDSAGASVNISVCADLAVGEAVNLDPNSASHCFAGGAGAAAEYLYVPVNTSASGRSLTITASGIAGVTGPPNPDLVPGGDRTLSPLLTLFANADDGDPHLARLERNRSTRRVLVGESRAAGAAPGPRASLSPGSPNAVIVPGVPSVGDLWTLNVASGCSGARDDRTGRVHTVSSRAIIVADTANPPGGFTTAQYDSIALEFDTIAYRAVTTAFGEPWDLDGNGRVVIFFTRGMNELSPPASSAVSFAEFRARDMFSAAAGSCERSNEGEILYMLTPDPTGSVNSNVRTVSYVRGSVLREAGHELQHLINASRRLYVSGASTLEEPWLDEGLSAIAEELMFYHTSFGLAPRANIILANLTTGPTASRRVAAFNTYANNNFGRLRSALQRPDTSTLTRPSASPPIAQMGGVWGLLRYSADRVGGDENAFWSAFTSSEEAGVATLEAAIGAPLDPWMIDYLIALYADDAVAGIDPRHSIPSWNYRSVYGGLGGFPLGTRPLTNGVGLTLTYAAGGGNAYGRFGVAAGGFAEVSLTSGGGAPGEGVMLAVLRTR